MYNLHKEVPYEGDYVVINGSLEEIKEQLKLERGSYGFNIDDYYLTQDPDVCLYDLLDELNGDK